MAQQPIWPGSASFSVSPAFGNSKITGSTPWGLYDTEVSFATGSIRFADWAAKRLGYPIMSVELQAAQFFACYEEERKPSSET